MMELTEDNYYTNGADNEYMSVSQYKHFMRCEASALAKLRGEYVPQTSKEMLVGSYVDNWMDGTLDRFKEEHPEVFTQKGELRAEFKKAEELIDLINKNDFFKKFIGGEHQRIFTFEMFGMPWKIKLDSFVEGVCITDLKVVKNTASLPFWRYDIQGAVYQAGVEAHGYGRLPFYLATITKEDIPDMNVFQIPQSQLDIAMNEVETNIPRIVAIKNGEEEPTRCEKCPYCRRTKQLKVRSYMELIDV